MLYNERKTNKYKMIVLPQQGVLNDITKGKTL